MKSLLCRSEYHLLLDKLSPRLAKMGIIRLECDRSRPVLRSLARRDSLPSEITGYTHCKHNGFVWVDNYRDLCVADGDFKGNDHPALMELFNEINSMSGYEGELYSYFITVFEREQQ